MENNTFNTINLIDDVPSEIKGRVALAGGILHISSELKGRLDMVSLFARLRRRGVYNYEFHEPGIFNAQYATYATSNFQGDNEVQQFAIELIAKAFDVGASDIHIVDFGTYTIIKFRCNGLLVDHTQLSAERGKRLIATIYQILAQSSDAVFSPTERQDGRIVQRKYLPPSVHAIRIHSEPIECIGEEGIGTAMCLRLLYDSTAASGTLHERLGQLGFSNDQCDTFKYLTRRTGLSIISGPTGHGKSTVLKHVMECMTSLHPERAYYSIEDPAEYPMSGVRQIKVNSNDQNERNKSYDDAIAGTMRCDPDILMIGEIRYIEAAKAAIDASLTGHGVWATVHASSALGIIPRLVRILSENMENPLEHLCAQNVLAGLEYQRLIPVLCPNCKIPFMELKNEEKSKYIPEDIQERLRKLCGDDREQIHVRGEGCELCKKSGLIGQTIAAEVIDTDRTLLEYLRLGKPSAAYEYWRKQKNGKSYLDHALELIKRGVVDPLITEERLNVPLDFNEKFIPLDSVA